ncbi:hypothetical protein ALC57_16060 [Trachymyrmex cornetzi]|uniref:Mutator-like transposase domain-containing protein n=1 Tax=Trachymyrmex cornetzi TaxID=471704 RepID=A0A151IVR4_9HYME|nr:hypothetical protein ALC57_16060 [Trachymyrmex cornetzi]
MDRKGSKKQPTRAGRQKKRHFRGNRFTVEKDVEFTSTLSKKLKTSENTDFSVSREFSYCILNFFSVFTTIATLVVCKQCKSDIQFNQTSSRGLGFKIRVKCNCNEILINSSPFINKAFEINRRIVFVFRLLGVAREGINLFCGYMDIYQGISTNIYYSCLDNIYIAASSVYKVILKSAMADEKIKNKEAGNIENHLTVSGDGTWKKRGYSSLFGVSTLIGKYSKKVLDSVVKSSFCQECNLWNNKKNENIDEYNEWYDIHEENCAINHNGSAGKMEIDAITEMFLRSKNEHGVLYVKYIGDGDSKTFKGILDVNPYGDEATVLKKECVDHVERRMGRRLRYIKKSNKVIGSKGAKKLADKMIGELTKYYGLAIRKHPDSVEDMKKEIWATYYHKSSTDESLQHQNCPEGENSWCKWRKAEAAGTIASFQHSDSPLNSNVWEIIKPIYENLSSDELLERCLDAETQINNESLNALIWNFAPKHLHCVAKTIEIATFLAVIIFNEGFLPILKVMDVMGVTIGQQAEMHAHSRNEARIRRSEECSSDFGKDQRPQLRDERAALHDMYEEEEGALYGPGIAD